jgi:hypothetical protein
MNIQILNKDQCGRAITRIARAGAKIQALIHQVAVSTLVHARDHGDVTLIERLLNGLPNGQRVKALAYWYAHFSDNQLTVKDVNGKFTVGIVKGRDETAFNVEGAALVTFAELTKESKPGKTFTMEQLVKKLTAWANEEGELDNGAPKVADDVRDAAAKFLSEIEGAKPRLRAVA